MRVGTRRLGSVLGAVAALGAGATLASQPALASADSPAAAAKAWPATGGLPAPASTAPASTAPASTVPAPVTGAAKVVEVASTLTGTIRPQVAPLRKLRPADLLVVAPSTLRASVAKAVRHLAGVTAVEQLDAATIKVNGKFVQMLGVNPGQFRAFAAGPTARSTSLWRNVAGGDIAVSYTMGKQAKLPLGSSVHVAGQRREALRVGGYGTVGIAGVDAVVSDAVARSLGIPAGNALVISAPHARLAALMKRVKAVLPRHAGVAQLVVQAPRGIVVPAQSVAAGAAGATSVTAGDGAGIPAVRVRAFLTAALSRVGMPYVWGAAGPRSFDCSGLVQWSMRQAGILMPRVAADQARTGPQVPLSQLRPGDLLFYHTDATAPTYISHVAIYIGNGQMLEAPHTGLNVEIVPADFGSGFAGAVRVYPAIAAAVAGNPAG